MAAVFAERSSVRVGVLYLNNTCFNCRIPKVTWDRIANGSYSNWSLQNLCGDVVSELQVPTDQKYIKQLVEGGIGELPDGMLGKLTENTTQPEQAPPSVLQTSQIPQTSSQIRQVTASSSVDDGGEGSQTEAEDARLWPHATVLLLLDVYRKKRHLLQLPTLKKEDVWKKIAADMRAYGYNFSASVCLKKWNNLKSRYKIICDRNKATGRGRTSWPYLDVMADLLHGDPAIVPPVVISSLSGVTVNTPERSGASTPTTAPTLTPKPSVASKSKASLLELSSMSTTQKHAACGVDDENWSRQKRRRRQEPLKVCPEPSQWAKDSQERMHSTLQEMVKAVQENTKAITKNNQILEEKNQILRELLEKL